MFKCIFVYINIFFVAILFLASVYYSLLIFFSKISDVKNCNPSNFNKLKSLVQRNNLMYFQQKKICLFKLQNFDFLCGFFFVVCIENGPHFIYFFGAIFYTSTIEHSKTRSNLFIFKAVLSVYNYHPF